MAKRSLSFEVDLSPSSASRAIREAIGEAGWECSETGDYMEAREDSTKLCCTISPVKAEIRVRECDGRVQIQLDGSIPGWGPIASRQLPDRLQLLERVIREGCAEAPPS
jgi:hypothetical protein